MSFSLADLPFIGEAFRGLDLDLFTRLIEKPDNVQVFSDQNRRRARALANALRNLGVRRFRAYWILGRLQVDLQMRLWVETVLFSMGKPWSDLVSGFKPLRTPL